MIETPAEIVLVLDLWPIRKRRQNQCFAICVSIARPNGSYSFNTWPATTFTPTGNVRFVARDLIKCSCDFTWDFMIWRWGSSRCLCRDKKNKKFDLFQFVCDYCGKRFGDSKALRKHKNSRVCGEKFQESLASKTHKCNFCDFRTTTAKLLMTHFRTLHVPKDQVCPSCSKEMTAKQYQSHKNYCNQGYVYCDFCGKRFANRKYLTGHCKSKHPETVKV